MSHGTPLHRLLSLGALVALAIVSCLSTFTVTNDVSAPGSTTFVDPRPQDVTPPANQAAPVVETTILPVRSDSGISSDETSRVVTRYRASESVTMACAQHELWNDCSKLNGFLERMRVEPRDPAWAAMAEARIRHAAVDGERGQFRIRALECRRTRCVLEVATESQNAGIAYIAAYDDGLTADTGTVAFEDDPQTGIRTLVFVQIWQKRETLLAAD